MSLWQFLFFLLSALGFQPLQAQQGWQFELWLRPQSTELINLTEERLDPLVNQRQQSWGMASGLGAGRGLTDRWSTWSGITYSMQQQDYRFSSRLLSGSEQRVLRELRAEYLQFPLRMEYCALARERIQIQIGVGGFAAALLRVTERNNDRRYRELPPPGTHFSQYPPRSATLQAWHFGLQARAGLTFKLRYNIRAFVHVNVESALGDIEDKSAYFLWTEDGLTERVAYYDQRHRPEFGPGRGASRWFVVGGQIGFRYYILRIP